MAKKKVKMKTSGWNQRGKAKLNRILKLARNFPQLGKITPKARRPWSADLKFVGSQAMSRMNRRYRRKKGTTDILSFPAPGIFQNRGHLGELVVCLPVLRRQALEFGHRESRELEILLIHGTLHLLGFDHERNRREAARMALWETKLLKKLASSSASLIVRARSGN